MGKLIFAVVAAVILLFAGCSSFTTVESNEVGIWKRFGEVSSDIAEPGLHWKNPFTTSLVTMPTSTTRWDSETAIYTADNQQANLRYSVIYRMDPAFAVPLYLRAREQWDDRFIPSAAERAVKDEFGRWTATRAVSQRPIIQRNATERLKLRLAPLGIIVESVDFTNIDYSDVFENAVEQAAVATQRAVAAQNQTVQVREQARQRVITAQSTAEAIQLEANAISANPAIVQMRAVEKWNGRLPRNMYGGGAVPFINVGGE